MRFPAAISNKFLGEHLAVLVVLLACLGQVLVATSAELPRVAEEYDLKAAFLFNLAKFVRWPAANFSRDDSPIVIGVRGDDALESFGRMLRDKSIAQHKILVQRLERVEDVKNCHIAFISRAEKDQVAEWAMAGKSAAVLTVGETQGFLEQGGMIRFSTQSDELRLEINEQGIRRAGLNIMANALSALVNKGIAKIRNS
jgi:hypothetical protein